MSGVIGRRFHPQGLRGIVRLYGQQTTSSQSTTTGQQQQQQQQQPNPNVPGLSDNCLAVPNGPVGPGAAKDKEYKNPEYYCYHVDSFAEAEVEMAKFRLPAPSNKRKFVPQ